MPKLKTKGKIHATLTGFDFTEDAPLPLRKAVRQKCLECCCGNPAEVQRKTGADSGRGKSAPRRAWLFQSWGFYRGPPGCPRRTPQVAAVEIPQG